MGRMFEIHDHVACVTPGRVARYRRTFKLQVHAAMLLSAMIGHAAMSAVGVVDKTTEEWQNV